MTKCTIHIETELSGKLAETLIREAAKRKVEPVKLLADIVEHVLEDDLIDAVLEDNLELP